jgi:hypothetical protein
MKVWMWSTVDPSIGWSEWDVPVQIDTPALKILDEVHTEVGVNFDTHAKVVRDSKGHDGTRLVLFSIMGGQDHLILAVNFQREEDAHDIAVEVTPDVYHPEDFPLDGP